MAVPSVKTIRNTMAEHHVKILKTEFILYNVKRFTVERPKGFAFSPGQATDICIDRPEWIKELRPFTPTCLPSARHLEFTIKIYDDHPGVTHQLGLLHAGDQLILHDVFGAIQYQGPGVFLAGGAGVTPFISILRDLHKKNKLKGNMLIFSNKTADDVILDEEFERMLKRNFIKIFTRQRVIGFRDGASTATRSWRSCRTSTSTSMSAAPMNSSWT
jgi:ferredoxin-NADP reductase